MSVSTSINNVSGEWFKPKIDKKTQKTRAVVSGILSLSDKLRSILRFNFNLDKSLQKFFQGISAEIYLN